MLGVPLGGRERGHVQPVELGDEAERPHQAVVVLAGHLLQAGRRPAAPLLDQSNHPGLVKQNTLLGVYHYVLPLVKYGSNSIKQTLN